MNQSATSIVSSILSQATTAPLRAATLNALANLVQYPAAAASVRSVASSRVVSATSAEGVDDSRHNSESGGGSAAGYAHGGSALGGSSGGAVGDDGSDSPAAVGVHSSLGAEAAALLSNASSRSSSRLGSRRDSVDRPSSARQHLLTLLASQATVSSKSSNSGSRRQSVALQAGALSASLAAEQATTATGSALPDAAESSTESDNVWPWYVVLLFVFFFACVR